MSEKEEWKRSALRKEAEKMIEAYIFNSEKLTEKQLRLTKAMGPMNPLEVNAWIFVLENAIKVMEKTEGYNKAAVELLKRRYETDATVYTGAPEEVRAMADKILNAGKPDE